MLGTRRIARFGFQSASDCVLDLLFSVTRHYSIDILPPILVFELTQSLLRDAIFSRRTLLFLFLLIIFIDLLFYLARSFQRVGASSSSYATKVIGIYSRCSALIMTDH